MRDNPAMAERREMIVALLEERPYSTIDLAIALELPSGMHQVCAQLARDGTIKRLVDGRWAHPSPAGDTAPPPPGALRNHIDGDAVLAQLQAGPIGCTAIAKVLGVGKKAVQNRLDVLAAAGAVRSVGQHTGLRWVLASWTAPPPAPPKPIGRPRTRPTVEEVVELDDPDDAVDEAADPDAAIVDELLERPRNERLGEGSHRLYPAGTRQVPVKKLRAAEDPAWWCQHAAVDQRDAFAAAAAKRNAEMCAKSQTWRSQSSVRQKEAR